MDEITQMIVPSRESDFLELARSQKGRLFRKHILNKGNLLHPKTGKPIAIDDDFIAKLTKNFQDKVCDIVQVPLAGPNNEHTEDPDRNLGEVVGIEEKDGKVYAILDIRQKAEAVGNTILGASAMMHMNYIDTRTGVPVGPTLLHVCATNRPYVVELEDYEELVAASAEGTDDDAVLLTEEEPAPPVEPEVPALTEDEEMAILDALESELAELEAEEPVEPETPQVPPPAATEETHKMDLDELLETLKSEHNIDVPALMATAAAAEGATQLSNTLATALTASGVVELSAGETITDEDIIGAVAELATTNVQLSNRLSVLEQSTAEAEVDALVAEGRITPAQRDSFVELKLSNEELFEKLVPAEAVVQLSNENGVAPLDQHTQEEDIDAEIARYAEQASKQGYVRS